MKIDRPEKKRVFLMSTIYLAWFLFIVFSLVKIQIFHYNKYSEEVRTQSNRILQLHPKRGTIYDARGDILATSIKTKSAYISNRSEAESEMILQRVNQALHLTPGKVRALRARINRGQKFIWIKRKLPESEYSKLKEVRKLLTGNIKSDLAFCDEYKRLYPQGVTASHILGGVGIDEQGLAGIEYTFDSQIMGAGGEVKVMMDARNKVFELKTIKEQRSGGELQLTIDSAIQFVVEEELARTVKHFSAKGGTIILMEAQTGHILAMASYPFYSPEAISTTSSQIRRNKAISFLYDPGSTFKVILAANALEHRVCSPQQPFDCHNGEFKIKNQTISENPAFKKLTFSEILIHSSNIGAALIGLELGEKRYHDGIRRFGFGRRTQIGLAGEEHGIFHNLDSWSQVSIAFLSFGYEILVTPIQMAQAFNVVASGGYLINPTILKTGLDHEQRKQRKTAVISPQTARTLSRIMVDVVAKGTGTNAEIKGLEIAGKTGTAKKVKNRRYRDDYVSSFGGFFPAANPRFTMFVMIDEPKGKYYGGDVAAPLFKKIVQKLLIHLSLSPGPNLKKI